MTLLLLALLAQPLRAQSQVAGGVVQSDEWIIRREVKEEEFKGNVRFDHGDEHVQADWALVRKALDLWTARGHLYASRLTRDRELFELWGHQAEYDGGTRDGKADGGGPPLRFRRTFTVEGATQAWNGTAGTARWAGADKRLYLEGGVSVDGAELGIRSQTARLDQPQRTGTFEGGRPVAHFGTPRYLTAMQADTVTLQDAPRRLTASGGVQGWLVLRKKNGTER